MIGNITLGGAFSGCIRYCLEDKIELTEDEKSELSISENLQHKNRAEVLFYNNCFGDAKELTRQFIEVSKLSTRTEKPVMHISLRLAPGDTLTKEQLTEIAQSCAEEFHFYKNQYICVLHKDTREPHIHIVANRVGYDGRAVNLSNNYRRMANFCRKMEQKYGLQKVLNPRKFLTKEQRLQTRHDIRKERLQKDIQRTLQRVASFDRFETEMNSLGYQMLKGRGISFIDDKKVKIKGSEVGFSLSKINQILSLRQKIELAPREEKAQVERLRNYSPSRALTSGERLLERTILGEYLKQLEKNAYYKMEKELVHLLFGPDKGQEQYVYGINPELLREAKKKKKKKKRLGLGR